MSDSAAPLTNEQSTITTTIVPFEASPTSASEISAATPAQSGEPVVAAPNNSPNLTVIIIAVSASLLGLAIIITIGFKLLQRRRRNRSGRRPSKIEEGGVGHGMASSPAGLLTVDGNIRNSDIPLSSPMPLLGVDGGGSYSGSFRNSANSGLDVGGGGYGWQGQVLMGGNVVEDDGVNVIQQQQARVVSAPMLMVASEKKGPFHRGSLSFSMRSSGMPAKSKRRTCPEPLDLKPLSRAVRAQSVDMRKPPSVKPVSIIVSRPNTLDLKPLPTTPTASEITIRQSNGTILEQQQEREYPVEAQQNDNATDEENHFSWRTNDDIILNMPVPQNPDTGDDLQGHRPPTIQVGATAVADTSSIRLDEPESPVLGTFHGEMNIVKAPETPRTPRRSLSEMRTAMNEHLERERQRELRELTQRLHNNNN